MKMIQIENRVAKVRLNDAVTPWSADDLIGDIERSYGNKAVVENLTVGGFQAKADDALETLEIEINSPGGSVLDGYRVYNALMQMRGRGVRVVATVNTLAASMGSVILMAADEVKIVEGGRIMIHEASMVVAGNSADHTRAAKNLEEISEEIAGIYASRTGADAKDMRELMKAETWMGAKEAVERGFADSILRFSKNEVDIRNDNPTPTRMSFLSKLFPSADADAIAKFEAEVQENQSLRDQLADAQGKITELTGLSAIVAEKEGELATAKAELKSFEAKVTDLETQVSDLTAKCENIQQQVAAQVVTELAQTGVEKPLEVSGATQSKEEILAEFKAMKPGPERSAFFAKHKAILSINS